MAEFRDVYSKITNRIIADLEQGDRPWMRPRSSDHAAGRITRQLRSNGIPYRGMEPIEERVAAQAGTSGGVPMFQNHYRCPRCNSAWSDVWPSQVDDDCPNCGLRHISPTSSNDAEGEEPD